MQKKMKPLYPKPHRNQLLEGIETHPRAEHFSSLYWCFLLSVSSRTAPIVAPASAKVEGFSDETTKMSRATGLPRFQFCNRISAGHDCEWLGNTGKSFVFPSLDFDPCSQGIPRFAVFFANHI